jgi:hypothetical protein
MYTILFFYIARETYIHIGGLPIDAPKVWKGAIEFLSQRAAVAVFGDMTTEVLNVMSLHPAAQEVAGKSNIVCIDDLKPDKRAKMAESYALAPRLHGYLYIYIYYIYKYIIYIHILYIYMYIYKYVYIYIHVYMYIYVCVFIYMFLYTHTFI